nr:M10 family metallopeptidase C-terminal domain-containing protein [Azospirillum oleiclasticum]
MQLYDIQALQYLYGANRGAATGDDTYIVSASAPEVRSIWDGGGTDTLDASAQTRAVRIDLNAGAFSSIGVNATGGAAVNNIAIAYGSTIENAVGGAGNDTLVGNAVDNLLTGGAGDDAFDGGAGSDVATYRGTRAQYKVWTENGRITVQDLVSGRDGTDTMVNVERLRFADGEVLASTAAAPLTGSAVSRSLRNGQTVALSDLYSAGNSDGRTVQYYWITDLAGAGLVNLNGAVNLATAAQKAAGGIQVSATDFAKLTYTGAGTETLGFQVFDGLAWSATANAKLTNSTPTGVGAPRALGTGKSVALSDLYAATDAEDSIQYYRVTNPAGAGTLSLNGAVDLANATQRAQGISQFSAADFAKVTYTGNGNETLSFMAHDGLGWSATTNVAVSNALPVGAGTPTALAKGATVALSDLYAATDAEDSIQYYRVTNPAGAGTLSLNGAVDLANATQRAQGISQFSAADFAKVTYTGNGNETLSFMAHDGLGWSATTNVAVSNALPVGAGTPTALAKGATVALSDLYAATDAEDSIQYYRVTNPAGAGTLSLNGAVDLANATQRAQGISQFSAADFAKVTYTGNGNETLSFMAHDGLGWSATTNVAVSNVAGIAVSNRLGIGQSVALSDLFSVTDADGDTIRTYRITDPAGAGRINLNGAVNLATTAQKAAGMVQVSAADFAKLTYTGSGTESLSFQAFDGVSWSTPVTARLTNSAPVGTAATVSLRAGEVVALPRLFSASDPEGDTIQMYRITDPAGAGRINLNGAVNLATTAQKAAGMVQVSAADFAKLTYTGSGAESLSFQAFDGVNWSNATRTAIAVTSRLVGIGKPRDLAPGQEIPLSLLYEIDTTSGITARFYRITDPAGGGGIQLNGVKNLASAADQARGVYQVTAAEYNKLTYTGSQGESLTFQVGDGTAWSAATQVAVTEGAPAAVLPSQTLKIGETVALSSFVTPDNSKYYHYIIYDNSATGTFNLNGAVNLNPFYNIVNIDDSAFQVFDLTPEDFAKVTYTGRGSATFHIERLERITADGPTPHDDLSLAHLRKSDTTTVVIGNRTPDGMISPASNRQGTALRLSDIYSAQDGDGDSVIYYRVKRESGLDEINLNGAVNVSSGADFLQGYYTVSANDFSKLTINTTGFNELRFQASDGGGWNAPITVILGEGAQATARRSVGLNATVKLAQLFDPGVLTQTGASFYRVEDPSGAGHVFLNGVANLASPADQAEGRYLVAASDMSKLTYTGGGRERITVQAVDASGTTTYQPYSTYVGNQAPVVRGKTSNIPNDSYTDTSYLMSVSDPENDPIVYYRFQHVSGNQIFAFDPKEVVTDASDPVGSIRVTAEGAYCYVHPQGLGSTIVQAFDGVSWSDPATITFAKEDPPPVVTRRTDFYLVPEFNETFRFNATWCTGYDANGALISTWIPKFRVHVPDEIGKFTMDEQPVSGYFAEMGENFYEISQLDGLNSTMTLWASGDIIVQAYDNMKWSAPTKLHFEVAPPSTTDNPLDFSPGTSITLRQLKESINRNWADQIWSMDPVYGGDWVSAVYIKDPSGAGSINLNGAPVNSRALASGHTFEAGEAVIDVAYLDQVTYTVQGLEKLKIGIIARTDYFGTYVAGHAPMELYEIDIGGAPVGTVTPQSLDGVGSAPLSNLVSFTDPNGDTIKYYQVTDPYGAGSLQLNGAVNRANANDTAQGKYQFVASDFGRLTYRANGAETLTVQAFDGQLWSDPTLVAVDGGGYVSGSGALFGSDRRIGT